MIDKSEIESWATRLPPSKLRTTILELLAELESARNAALEEAAMACDGVSSCLGWSDAFRNGAACCARKIRALATNASTEPASRGAAQGRITQDNGGGSSPADAGGLTPEPSYDHLRIALGKGLIEVGQGHDGSERLPAILFGRNGAGAVGVETEGDRLMLPGECIAAITFENAQSLDVVAEKLAELRARIWPDAATSASASPAAAVAAPVPAGRTAAQAIERIFQSWDGCKYDHINIGESLREDFAEVPGFSDFAAAAPAVPVPAEQDQARDAARYRWLRNEANNVRGRAPLVFACEPATPLSWIDARHGEQLDYAVDVAMAAPSLQQPKEGSQP